MTAVDAQTCPPRADSPVASWLLPMTNDSRVALEKAITHGSASNEQRARPLRTLGTVARRALVDEIETKLRAVLGESVGDLVIAGWQKHATIRKAIATSNSQPGTDQIVSLYKHTIAASHQHSLNIVVDGFEVMSLPVELTMRAQLCDATAVVSDGHVCAIRSGEANVEGLVTVSGVQVSRRRLLFPLKAELVVHSSRRPIVEAHTQHRAVCLTARSASYPSNSALQS
jgi:hypothetical protein